MGVPLNHIAFTWLSDWHRFAAKDAEKYTQDFAKAMQKKGEIHMFILSGFKDNNGTEIFS